MNRRNLIKNGIMALCASLLPEILRPMDVELLNEMPVKKAMVGDLIRYNKTGEFAIIKNIYGNFVEGKFVTAPAIGIHILDINASQKNGNITVFQDAFVNHNDNSK